MRGQKAGLEPQGGGLALEARYFGESRAEQGLRLEAQLFV